MNDRMNDRTALDRHDPHDLEQSDDPVALKGARASSITALGQALSRLGDPELLGRLERLVSRRGRLTAELLVHLGEVDRRKLYLAEACSSMHGYCTARLHLSDAAAYRHIRAARLGRQFPLLLELVAEGKLHLTAICLLSPYLNSSNHRPLLQAAVHRTKREVELLVAERFPRPDVPSQLRRLPEPKPRPRGTSTERAEQPAELQPRSRTRQRGRARLATAPRSRVLQRHLQRNRQWRLSPRRRLRLRARLALLRLRARLMPPLAPNRSLRSELGRASVGEPWSSRLLPADSKCSSPLANRSTTSCGRPRI